MDLWVIIKMITVQKDAMTTTLMGEKKDVNYQAGKTQDESHNKKMYYKKKCQY